MVPTTLKQVSLLPHAVFSGIVIVLQDFGFEFQTKNQGICRGVFIYLFIIECVSLIFTTNFI